MSQEDFQHIYYENCKILSQQYSKLASMYAKMGEGKKLEPSDLTHLSKKHKDPNMPKRPMTSFILFCKDKRELLRNLYPDFTVQELTRKLGDLWKNASASEKHLYEEKAKDAKNDYLHLMEDYLNGSASPKKESKNANEEDAKSIEVKEINESKIEAVKKTSPKKKTEKKADEKKSDEKKSEEKLHEVPAKHDMEAKETPKKKKKKVEEAAAATPAIPVVVTQMPSEKKKKKKKTEEEH